MNPKFGRGASSGGGRTTLRARLLLAIGSVVATLCLVEFGGRAVGLSVPIEPQFVGQPMSYTQLKGNRAVGMINKPGVYRVAYHEGDGGEPKIVTATVNPDCFRGRPMAHEKQPGVIRIACLGDSYTFGHGVNDDETWPFLLERHLNQTVRGGNFETLNAGVNNYDTRQSVGLLKWKITKFFPDVVLLAFFLNDASIHTIRSGSQHEFGSPPPIYNFLKAHPISQFVRSHSRVADVISDRVVRHRYLEFLAESRSKLYDADSAGWKICQAELLDAKDTLRAQQVPFVVVLYPLLFRNGNYLATHDAYATVAKFLEESQIRYIDLEPAFLEHDVDQLRVHPCDSHPNATGQRIAAEAISEYLKDQHILRERKPK